MKKGKLAIILIVSLALVVAGVVTFLLLSNKKEEPTKPTPKPETSASSTVTDATGAKEFMGEINDLMLNGASKEEIEKALGVGLTGYASIHTGKDSYLQFVPPEDLVANYKLSDYVKQAAIYALRVEEKIKSNFAFEVVAAGAMVEGGDTIITAKVKAYLYQNYLADLGVLQNRLLEDSKSQTGYDVLAGDAGLTDQASAVMYKAKVKAMEIMDKHLDDYTSDEYVETNIVLEKGQRDKSNLASYMATTVTGMNTSESGNMSRNIEARINTYVNSAMQDGTLDKNDLLKLKAGS